MFMTLAALLIGVIMIKREKIYAGAILLHSGLIICVHFRKGGNVS